MAILFFAEDVSKPKIKLKAIKSWIINVIDSFEKRTGDISYIFCSDKYLIEVNKEFLNHNYYTDIITFDYCVEDTISGDIFISLDRIEENAKEYGTYDTELYRVMIHGILHLIGFDDHNEEDRQLMRREEDNALKVLEVLL